MALNNRFHVAIRKTGAVLAGIVLACASFAACKAPPEKSYTIGIVAGVPFRDEVIDGFRAGMSDLDYVEGGNITYVYNMEVVDQADSIDSEIDALLKKKVDLILTLGNRATLRAQQAVEGTDVPVVFAAVSNPVGEGIVESLLHPGGNLSGIQVGLEVPKTLEWMAKIVPNTRKVFLPYNPDDAVSVMFVELLAPFALQLDLEMVLAEIGSVEEGIAAIGRLPPDIQAIFRIPSPTLDPRNNDLSRAAIDCSLPMVAGHPLDEDVLLMLKSDLFDVGRRSSRIVHQILNGIKPSSLPVETSEVTMVINLKTAGAIGLEIPDMVLHQADQVVR
jgi:putative ABC transport system substrate-binding protein